MPLRRGSLSLSLALQLFIMMSLKIQSPLIYSSESINPSAKTKTKNQKTTKKIKVAPIFGHPMLGFIFD
jgi:hypothetical protein